jgi:hypothetical protein
MGYKMQSHFRRQAQENSRFPQEEKKAVQKT